MTVYALPSYSQVRALFIPVESVGRSRYGSGVNLDRTQTMETVYRCEVTTPPLTRAQRADWRAWRNKLRGGLNYFTAYDISRHPPRNYPTALDPSEVPPLSPSWNGTAIVAALGASGSLGLEGLPPGYVVKADDPIGLEEGGQYDYYAAVDDATADGAGAVTVTVSPFLRTGIFTTAATARLWQPLATFVLQPDSWSEDALATQSPISFAGMQAI